MIKNEYQYNLHKLEHPVLILNINDVIQNSGNMDINCINLTVVYGCQCNFALAVHNLCQLHDITNEHIATQGTFEWALVNGSENILQSSDQHFNTYKGFAMEIGRCSHQEYKMSSPRSEVFLLLMKMAIYSGNCRLQGWSKRLSRMLYFVHYAVYDTHWWKNALLNMV